MFHVPNAQRIRTGPMASADHAGNNGAFFFPGIIAGRKLWVIASDSEQWKPVEDYETLYEVSTLGKVRAFAKHVALPQGAMRSHEQHELAQETIEKGYKRVSLCHKGETEKVLVHLLIARAFIDNPHNYPVVNHQDGNKTNNHVENLEWCTTEYNHHHAIEHGLRTGWKSEDIDRVKEMIAAGMSSQEIAMVWNRPRQTIGDIKADRHRNLTPDAPSKWEGLPHWEHISVHAANRTNKLFIPTWQEMCWIKDQFWDDEDTVMQLHPPQSTWVNTHAATLHLWRPIGQTIPLPPSILVGIKGLQLA